MRLLYKTRKMYHRSIRKVSEMHQKCFRICLKPILIAPGNAINTSKMHQEKSNNQ